MNLANTQLKNDYGLNFQYLDEFIRESGVARKILIVRGLDSNNTNNGILDSSFLWKNMEDKVKYILSLEMNIASLPIDEFSSKLYVPEHEKYLFEIQKTMDMDSFDVDTDLIHSILGYLIKTIAEEEKVVERLRRQGFCLWFPGGVKKIDTDRLENMISKFPKKIGIVIPNEAVDIYRKETDDFSLFKKYSEQISFVYPELSN